MSIEINSLLNNDDIFKDMTDLDDMSLKDSDVTSKHVRQSSQSQTEERIDEEVKFVREDIEDMTKELERIRDFIFKKQETAVSPTREAKKTRALKRVGDEIFSN